MGAELTPALQMPPVPPGVLPGGAEVTNGALFAARVVFRMSERLDPTANVDPAQARRLLASCPVVLLDMNGTFMFGENRLGPDEDFGATYCAIGGRVLRADAVAAAVLACVAHMARLYDDPAHADDFPSVLEVMGELPDTSGLPERERRLLAEVVARHELGRIPEPHAQAVRELARAHRLGLVANIWAPKDPWLAELARAGLADVFAARVFSSNSRSMKPSPRLFHEALRGCDASRHKRLEDGGQRRVPTHHLAHPLRPASPPNCAELQPKFPKKTLHAVLLDLTVATAALASSSPGISKMTTLLNFSPKNVRLK